MTETETETEIKRVTETTGTTETESTAFNKTIPNCLRETERENRLAREVRGRRR